jgi:hypothetical protein
MFDWDVTKIMAIKDIPLPKIFRDNKKESTIPMIMNNRLCILSCSIDVGKMS